VAVVVEVELQKEGGETEEFVQRLKQNLVRFVTERARGNRLDMIKMSCEKREEGIRSGRKERAGETVSRRTLVFEKAKINMIKEEFGVERKLRTETRLNN
jgi:hypothetical protein